MQAFLPHMHLQQILTKTGNPDRHTAILGIFTVAPLLKAFRNVNVTFSSFPGILLAYSSFPSARIP
ncbi:hypothetical protein Hanom_Chr12g01093751 [Helianthus anomalus]